MSSEQAYLESQEARLAVTAALDDYKTAAEAANLEDHQIIDNLNDCLADAEFEGLIVVEE